MNKILPESINVKLTAALLAAYFLLGWLIFLNLDSHAGELFLIFSLPVITAAAIFQLRGGVLAGAAAGLLLLATPAGLNHISSRLIGSTLYLALGLISGGAFSYLYRKLNRLRLVSLYDPGTGLPNLSYLKQRLEEISSSSRDIPLYLVMLEINNHTEIISSIGHRWSGDFLGEVASHIERRLRQEKEILQRDSITFEAFSIHDDRLALLIDELDRSKLEEIVERLNEILTETIDFHGIPLYIDTYMGVATLCGLADYREKEPDTLADELLQDSYQALHEARRSSEGLVFHSECIQQKKTGRLPLLAEVDRAIKEDQFTLQYQPQIALPSDRIVSAEALIRWHHPRRGHISPADFIPRVEKTALINRLSYWVLERAAEDLLILEKEGLEINMAVNISPHNLQKDNFLEAATTKLEECALSPSRFELELTETDVMEELSRGGDAIDMLIEAGFRVSLDDFGTGYSSLSYLKNLDFDYIKVDRSFVHDITQNSKSYEIASTAIALGHQLNSEVVAEGVEQKQDLDLLTRMGCDFAQGYYISAPLDLTDFIDFHLEWQGF